MATGSGGTSSSSTYSSKTGSYSSGFGPNTNYESLSNSNEYKSAQNVYSQNSKTCPSTCSSNTNINSNEMNASLYSKPQSTMNKVNCFI